MPTLTEQVAALATRLGQEIKALRTGKANDNAVVHLTGNETVGGIKTFSSAPQVPVGSLLANPVRRDDARLTDARTALPHAASHAAGGTDPVSGLAPTGGTTGQVLTKTGAADHAMAWATLATGVGGIVDCSAMTLASQVNAASAAAPQGSIIWLGARRTTPLSADETLIARPYQKLMGPGGRNQLGGVRAAASLPAGQPIVASQGYMNNGTAADNPCAVEGLFIDAQSKAGSHGLVVYTFWGHFQDIQIANVAGANARGISATDRTINGTTVSANSHSENTFVRCRFYDFTGGATAFWAESYNGQSNQDGHLQDCFFASISGYGIYVGRSAGWTIENNHLYGIGYDGICLNKVYATKVINNYVEDFGGQNAASPGAPTYGYYNGINLGEVLNTRGSVLALNTVSTAQPSSPSGNLWACFYARAGSGQSLANLVVSGNVATWANSTAPATSRSWAFRFGEGGDTGRMLTVQWSGNLVQPVAWWAGTRFVAGSTVTVLDVSAHIHDAGDITTGTLGAARLPIGTTSGTVAAGDDSRFADARTPTTHAATHAAGGTDALTPAAIGAAATSHTHSAGNITSGTFDITRIPTASSGASNATTVVRADDARLSNARVPTAHTHDAADITSGLLAVARLPVGTAADTVAAGNDARFTDARVPTAHAASHGVGGSDDLSGSYVALTGAQTVAGVKTFTSGAVFSAPPSVAQGTAAGHAARRDDTRFLPSGGLAGQVLAKTSDTNYAVGWTSASGGGGAGGSYVIGDVPAGNTAVTITHGLGTTDVVVMIRATTGNRSWVPVANDAPTTNTVTLSFTTAPTTGQYRYVIFAAIGSNVGQPAAHATTHAAGGSDPLTPAAIGAAETAHAHAAGDITSGTFDIARVPTGTSGTTVALGNHTHTQYAATSHAHAAGDITSGTFAIARVPTGTTSTTVALGNHTHTPAAIGAAAAAHVHGAGDTTSGVFDIARLPVGSSSDTVASGTHTHPRIMGPYSASVAASGLSAGPKSLASITVPDPGFDWRPMAFAQVEMRTDVSATRPALWVRLGSTTGGSYASGAVPFETTAYCMVQTAPLPTGVLAAGSDRTFFLTAANVYGGGWIQTTTLMAAFMIYVVPA